MDEAVRRMKNCPGEDRGVGWLRRSRRLPADSHPDARELRVLLGAARERRDAPSPVPRLDPGPQQQGPVLRAATDHGRRDVRADQP